MIIVNTRHSARSTDRQADPRLRLPICAACMRIQATWVLRTPRERAEGGTKNRLGPIRIRGQPSKPRPSLSEPTRSNGNAFFRFGRPTSPLIRFLYLLPHHTLVAHSKMIARIGSLAATALLALSASAQTTASSASATATATSDAAASTSTAASSTVSSSQYWHERYHGCEYCLAAGGLAVGGRGLFIVDV